MQGREESSGLPSEKKHYEFPIQFNPLLTGEESFTSLSNISTSLTKMNATIDDFTVKIGTVKIDLNPCEQFKIIANADIDYELAIGKKFSDFLPAFSQNSAITGYITKVLTNNGIDLSSLMVQSVRLFGPNARFNARYGGGFGLNLGANIGGIELVFGYEGQEKQYQLSLGNMLGYNVGGGFKSTVTHLSQDKEVKLFGWKLGFSAHEKPGHLVNNNRNTSRPSRIPSQPAALPASSSASRQAVRLPSQNHVTPLASSGLYKNIQTKLHAIQTSQIGYDTKVTQVLSEIRGAYKVLNEQKQLQQRQRNEELVRANFQGVMDGFQLIQQFGAQSGNHGVEKIGMAGLALAQGTLGFAQLTGTFGLTAVQGLAMISPITAVAGAALSLGSLVFHGFGHKKNKKQGKALQKMCRQLSEQIVQVHKDVMQLNHNMGKGFVAVLTGIDTLNTNLNHGVLSLHEALARYFTAMGEVMSGHYEDLAKRLDRHVSLLIENQEALYDSLLNGFNELDIKLSAQALQLSKMDEKLNLILAQQQQAQLHTLLQQKQELDKVAERYNYLHNEKDLIKLLQGVREQLVLATTQLKSLPLQGNVLSGWYHLGSLASLLQQPAFHHFTLDLNTALNLEWAEPIFAKLFDYLPVHQDHGAEKELMIEVFNKVKISLKGTADLLQTIAGKDFLTEFFSFYTNKLKQIHDEAEAILSPLRALSQPEILAYVRLLLQQSIDSETAKHTMRHNTDAMARQISARSLSELAEKVGEYNACLLQCKQTTSVLLSILAIDEQTAATITTKLAALQPIHEQHYHSKGAIKVKRDSSLPEGCVYYYFDIDPVNHFSTFSINADELVPLIENAADYADAKLNYLATVANCAEINLMVITNTIPLDEPPVFNSINFTRTQLVMKGKLESTEVTQTLDLIRRVHEFVVPARKKSVVYVMGATGDGKSTLLNTLAGSRYTKEIVDGDLVPKWDTKSAAEQCKVGVSISQSETLMPQLVDINYNNQKITYCDLPGLDGSRERAVTVCESYIPMILNTEVKEIRGLVWVLSDLHFKTVRSREVKELLSYLLRIARNKPETIAQSLTLVITKGSEYLTKDHVIKKLRDTVAAMLDSQEKDLLNQVITALERSQTNSIIVTQIYDANHAYKNAIHQAVLSKPVIPKEACDFSLYNREQTSFKRQIDKALAHRQKVREELTMAKQALTQCTTFIAAKNNQSHQAEIQQQQNQQELKQATEQVEQLAKQSADYLAQSVALENSSEKVKVHHITQKINGQTYQQEIEEPTGTFVEKNTGTSEPQQKTVSELVGYRKKKEEQLTGQFHLKHHTAKNNFEAAKARFQAQGYQIAIERPTKHKTHVVIRATRYVDDLTQPIYQPKTVTTYVPKKVKVPVMRKTTVAKEIPLGHPIEYRISFPAGYPVEVKVNNATGWTIKAGSENKQTGYHATIVYEQGRGCEVDVEILTAKKYSVEGKNILETLRASRNHTDAELSKLTKRCKELGEKISQNDVTLVGLKQELTCLAEQKIPLEKDIQEITKYLEVNEGYFNSLQTLNELLTPAPSLADNRYRLHPAVNTSNATVNGAAAPLTFSV